MTDNKIHPMRIVARRSGLSSHVIRAWERRHNAIEPARTPTNRRLYSDNDIERLQKLHRATRLGHSISQIAHFSADELDTLIAADTPHPEQIQGTPPATSDKPSPPTSPQQDPADYIKNALSAVRNLDAKTLEEQLFRAEIDMGRNKLLLQVIEPLMQQIGTLWSEGSLRIADEHMATSVIRSFLGTLQNSAPSAANSPLVVITTPAGQWHEIGALLASLTATAAGWRVIYLGPNLPAEEIAGVALQHQAQAVALSIIYYSEGDHQLGAELSKLRRALGDTAHILLGGRAAQQHSSDLKTVNAELLPDLSAFSTRLQSLNTAPSA
jgi:MerR family transcriptional regulator, light-induced transcriptional regulator